MPTVPVYGGPRIAPDALRSPRIDADATLGAFGGGAGPEAVAGQARGLAGDLAGMYQKQIEDADRLAVQDARVSLAKAKAEILYNPETGALNTRGEQAMGLPEKVRDGWTQKVSRIRAGLKSDRQREAFEPAAEMEALDLDTSVAAHMTAELRKHDDQSTRSFIAAQQDTAVRNAGDPALVERSINEIQTAIYDSARRNGTDDFASQEFEETRSKTLMAVLGSLLSQNLDLDAKAFAEKHRKEFTADDAPHAEKVLASGSLRIEARRKADAILALQTGGPAVDLGAALKDARKIADEGLRDAVEKNVIQDVRLNQAAAEQRQDDLYRASWNEAGKTGVLPPDGVMDQLDPGQQQSIRAYLGSILKPGDPLTDRATFYELKIKAAREPADFANPRKTDLLAYRTRLSNADFQEMVDLQARTISSGPDVATGYLTTLQRVDGALLSLGLDTTPTDEKAAKTVVAFRTEVDRVIRERTKPGVKMSGDEIQKIVDETVLNNLKETGWYRKSYEFVPASLAPIVVSESDRLKIVETFQKRYPGRVPTEAQIVEIMKNARP